MTIDAFNAALPPNPGRQWRDVPGLEGRYAASDDGYIGSFARDVDSGQGRLRRIRPRILKPIIMKTKGKVRSAMVNVHAEDGSSLGGNIGRLVLLAFVGDAPDCIASFRDGNPANTRLDNLHWTTMSTVLVARGVRPRNRPLPQPVEVVA